MALFKPDEHQRRAVREFLRGSYLLVWDPGVGKTWPVVEASRRTGGQTLVVVPAHLRDQWAGAYSEHASNLSVAVLEGLDLPIGKNYLAAHDVFICSYEFVSHEPRWRELRGHKWENIALDECHYLMRTTANRTRAILGAKRTSKGALVRAARAVWPLSGTPFTFPNEIYPLLAQVFPTAVLRGRDDAAGPKYLTAREWENKFCVVQTTRFGEKIVDVKNVPELRERIGPYLDKVKLSEVHSGGNVTDHIPIRGDLSKLTEGLDPDLLDQYDTLRDILENDSIPDADKLFELANSGLDMAQLRHNIAVAKVAATADMVRFELETRPGKICVYGWHREPMKALAKSLKAPLIFGGITPKAKADAKARFTEDPHCRVLCGQITAIGTGTDGLQHAARRGIFMEADWAARNNKQAVHRLFRRGQAEDTYHSFLSLHGSVDEYVARVLARNAEIIKRALD